MSYLDQFLKETNSSCQNTYDNLPVQNLLYQGGSIESEEGDIEDNRALSMSSSKSNLSELSLVSINLLWLLLTIFDFIYSSMNRSLPWNTKLTNFWFVLFLVPRNAATVLLWWWVLWDREWFVKFADLRVTRPVALMSLLFVQFHQTKVG